MCHTPSRALSLLLCVPSARAASCHIDTMPTMPSARNTAIVATFAAAAAVSAYVLHRRYSDTSRVGALRTMLSAYLDDHPPRPMRRNSARRTSFRRRRVGSSDGASADTAAGSAGQSSPAQPQHPLGLTPRKKASFWFGPEVDLEGVAAEIVACSFLPRAQVVQDILRLGFLGRLSSRRERTSELLVSLRMRGVLAEEDLAAGIALWLKTLPAASLTSPRCVKLLCHIVAAEVASDASAFSGLPASTTALVDAALRGDMRVLKQRRSLRKVVSKYVFGRVGVGSYVGGGAHSLYAVCLESLSVFLWRGVEHVPCPSPPPPLQVHVGRRPLCVAGLVRPKRPCPIPVRDLQEARANQHLQGRIGPRTSLHHATDARADGHRVRGPSRGGVLPPAVVHRRAVPGRTQHPGHGRALYCACHRGRSAAHGLPRHYPRLCAGGQEVCVAVPVCVTVPSWVVPPRDGTGAFSFLCFISGLRVSFGIASHSHVFVFVWRYRCGLADCCPSRDNTESPARQTIVAARALIAKAVEQATPEKSARSVIAMVRDTTPLCSVPVLLACGAPTAVCLVCFCFFCCFACRCAGVVLTALCIMWWLSSVWHDVPFVDLGSLRNPKWLFVGCEGGNSPRVGQGRAHRGSHHLGRSSPRCEARSRENSGRLHCDSHLRLVGHPPAVLHARGAWMAAVGRRASVLCGLDWTRRSTNVCVSRPCCKLAS